MKAIIIGAGRGSRLEHLTDEVPKTLVEVMGRPMLDQILEALFAAGFTEERIVFISGYRAEVVKSRYPRLTYVDNLDWEHNNILASLLKARALLSEGFVSTYADIVYSKDIATRVAASTAEFALGCDVDWRRRYIGRTNHPESDAEKMRGEGGRVVELSRKIASEAASGEFIGVMKASATGAKKLCDAFDDKARVFVGKTYREGRTWEKAYLIDLLANMIEDGVAMHHIDTVGKYMEIDTLQDREFAESWWNGAGV
jgi:L-glutamine-phosphate cytidylyltransferase